MPSPQQPPHRRDSPGPPFSMPPPAAAFPPPEPPRRRRGRLVVAVVTVVLLVAVGMGVGITLWTTRGNDGSDKASRGEHTRGEKRQGTERAESDSLPDSLKVVQSKRWPRSTHGPIRTTTQLVAVGDGTADALEPRTGKTAWRRNLKWICGNTGRSGDLAYFSSSPSGNQFSCRTLTAFDAHGKRKWQRPLPFHASITATDDDKRLIAFGLQEPRLLVLDPATGKTLQRASIPSCAIRWLWPGHRSIVFSQRCGNKATVTRVATETGRTTTILRRAGHAPPRILAVEPIIAMTTETGPKRLLLYDHKGKELANRSAPDCGKVTSIKACALPADDLLVLRSTDRVVAYRRDGTLAWGHDVSLSGVGMVRDDELVAPTKTGIAVHDRATGERKRLIPVQWPRPLANKNDLEISMMGKLLVATSAEHGYAVLAAA